MTSIARAYSVFSNRGRFMLLVMLFAAFSVVVACGSEAESGDAESIAPASSADDDLAEISEIIAPEMTFTFDDYVAAGWKKSKQYDTATVPEATDIWYGFYGGRDIELRFYESHEIARSVGFDAAAAAIDLGEETKVARNAIGGSASTKYKAFVVVGNTIMLCELAIESCIALVDALGVEVD